MIKLFISQPMRDKINEEIWSEREKAFKYVQEYLGNKDVVIIDSFFVDAPHDAKPLWFLGKSLELLSTADVAYFCNGWEECKRCRIEHACAREYGIDIIE